MIWSRVRVAWVSLVVCSCLVWWPPAAVAQQPAAERIVIVFGNDDGFDAPGLQALIKAFAGSAELYVSAPAQNQSGKGHSITIGDPILVRERQVEGVTRALAIDATPATALRVGLEKFIGQRPDLVISGINRGENLGTAVYLSGTLGAAREAVFTGIPAIAVSMAGNRSEDYVATAVLVRRLVDDLRARQLLRPGFFLNVNAPGGTPKGVKVTRLSVLASQQLYDCTSFVRERAACFSGYEQVKADQPDTDVQAFFEGYVTLTPLTLDSTDAKAMAGLAALAGATAPAVK
jgi:5'-nucleotidase